MVDKYHVIGIIEHGDECVLCSVSGREYEQQTGRRLDVHHIDGDHSNENPENLIPVCRQCHQNVHYGRRGFEELHEQLSKESRWDVEDEDWKTMRVPTEEWKAAKEAKEANDETWGEYLIRCSNAPRVR